MSYTKGPWKHDDVWALIKGPMGEEVAAIHSGQNDGERVDRNIAYENATLIAAAPELVEALEQAHNIIINILTDSQLDERTPCGVTVRNYISTVEKALTKAKGGQP